MTVKQTLRGGLSAVGLMLAGGLAYAAGQYGPGASDTEIKIGQTQPYSGPASAYSAIAKAEKAYFDYLYAHARSCHGEGMTPLQAARSIGADRWAEWGERERLVVNVANIYAELDGEQRPLDPLAAFQQMAELARSS